MKKAQRLIYALDIIDRGFEEPPDKRDQAAVALGRSGRLKGGAVRAKNLSAVNGNATAP
jgi:hypothetical protein